MSESKKQGAVLLNEALVLTEVALDALTKERTNAYTSAWRRNARWLAVSAAVGAACAYVSVKSLVQMRRAARQNHAWKAMDASLDRILKESENSSEPTAVY